MYKNGQTQNLIGDLFGVLIVIAGFTSLTFIIASPFFLYHGYMQYECNTWCEPQVGIYIQHQCKCRELK
jgi:hypothetical protein